MSPALISLFPSLTCANRRCSRNLDGNERLGAHLCLFSSQLESLNHVDRLVLRGCLQGSGRDAKAL